MIQPTLNNAQRVNQPSFAKKTHPCANKNMVPRAVLMRSGLVSLNTARQVNTAYPKSTLNVARPKIYISKTAHSTVKRPIHMKTTFNNSKTNQRVNTVKAKIVNTTRPKEVVNAVKGNLVNVVKASACWGNPQMALKDQGVIDSGCSRHMSYLTDYEELDRGYVAFRGNPKGWKITRKDDFSRFTWVFLLATKDETSGILKSFITRIENLVDHKVKYSVARTPQHNGVAKRRNRILIKAARTMLADSKLPITFWAEAVNTACYVQNRVIVVKPHNKTSYELLHGRTPTLSFMKPFGCPVTILNTKYHFSKFDGKANKGFFIGYALNSKVFRVFNSRTRIVEENLHVRFSENTPNVVGSRSNWLFDIDALTRTMIYEPIIAGTQSNDVAGTKENVNTGQASMEKEPVKNYILLPSSDNCMKVNEDSRKEGNNQDQEKHDYVNSTNNVNIISSTINTASTNEDDVVVQDDVVEGITSLEHPDDPNMPPLEDDDVFNYSDAEDVGGMADMNNIDTTYPVSPFATTRIHKDHILTKNKKDERGIMVRNKARLVAQVYTQEKGIDYDEVFALVARIKAIRLFLAYDSFKDFVVYQMDVKSAFLYENIKEEVYVCQPLGFEDPDFLDRVYKNELCIAFEKLMHEKFQMSSMGELTFFLGLQSASTPMESQKPLLKDEDGEDVDVHMYLKGHPKLGLWYLKDSTFDLVAYTDSDYAGAKLSVS
ncbi:retrovirus-related pol polyprotein from transposon TNT 1-94 [Tanacetum coccineum]|uniref:Retrovirus-related pol polyprotein from transposon TNT 1-94 n=1 Tax=Tanacetum coccineum TaxID=301880 RepID=A0ABQ5J7G9_9ASTR